VPRIPRLAAWALILAASLCSGCARGPAPVFFDMVCQLGAYRAVGWIVPLHTQRPRPDFLVVGFGVAYSVPQGSLDSSLNDSEGPKHDGDVLESTVEPIDIAGVKVARDLRTWLRCETGSTRREET
jgi:hypothetical protein